MGVGELSRGEAKVEVTGMLTGGGLPESLVDSLAGVSAPFSPPEEETFVAIFRHGQSRAERNPI